MKILHVTSPKISPSTFDKSGDTKVALTILESRPDHHLLGNNVDGALDSLENKVHHLPLSRCYGVTTCKMLDELASSYDVIIVHIPYLAICVRLKGVALSNKPVKFILVHHTPPDISVDISYRNAAAFQHLNQCENVHQVFVSKNHYQRYLSQLNKGEVGLNVARSDKVNRSSVIYSGVCPNAYGLSGSSEFEVKPDFDICVIGRLDMSKKIVESLQLALSISDRVLYVGSIENASAANRSPRSKAYLDEFQKLESKITHIERLDNKDLVKNWIPRCKVNLTLAGSETFGLTLIESALVGVPTLALDRGGHTEIINSLHVGKLLSMSKLRKSGRIKVLKRAFDDISDLPVSDKILLSRSVQSSFSLDKMISSYEKLINSAASFNKCNMLDI